MIRSLIGYGMDNMMMIQKLGVKMYHLPGMTRYEMGYDWGSCGQAAVYIQSLRIGVLRQIILWMTAVISMMTSRISKNWNPSRMNLPSLMNHTIIITIRVIARSRTAAALNKTLKSYSYNVFFLKPGFS